MLITIAAAANHLSVSTQTIRRMLNAGTLTRLKIGHSTRIAKSEVDGFVRKIRKTA